MRPLSVPQDATAALAMAINQPGSGRLWIGTAPDGGDVGLAYTDDGGASWTDVELPPSLRPTSEELVSVSPGGEQLLVVAATGDIVAVAARWVMSGVDHRLFVSADAGESWDVVPVDPGRGGGVENGRRLSVMDERLVFAVSSDSYLIDVFVSNSASDWSQLEAIDDLSNSGVGVNRAEFDVGQRGVASLYTFDGRQHQSIFSTDLSDWWSIFSLPTGGWRGPGQ